MSRSDPRPKGQRVYGQTHFVPVAIDLGFSAMDANYVWLRIFNSVKEGANLSYRQRGKALIGFVTRGQLLKVLDDVEAGVFDKLSETHADLLVKTVNQFTAGLEA